MSFYLIEVDSLWSKKCRRLYKNVLLSQHFISHVFMFLAIIDVTHRQKQQLSINALSSFHCQLTLLMLWPTSVIAFLNTASISVLVLGCWWMDIQRASTVRILYVLIPLSFPLCEVVWETYCASFECRDVSWGNSHLKKWHLIFTPWWMSFFTIFRSICNMDILRRFSINKLMFFDLCVTGYLLLWVGFHVMLCFLS